MKRRFVFSKPYINKEKRCFERTSLNPKSDIFGLQYTPFTFSPDKNAWFGMEVQASDGSNRVWKTRLRFPDKKFGNWYRRVGYKAIERIFREEEVEKIRETQQELALRKIEFEKSGGASLSEKEIWGLRQIKSNDIHFVEKEIVNKLIDRRYVNVERRVFHKNYSLTDKGLSVVRYVVFKELKIDKIITRYQN